MKHLLTIGLLLAVASTAAAKKDRAPLPQELLAAKTVYIDNQSGFAAVGDSAQKYVSNWKRFQLIDEPATADIKMVFSYGNVPMRTCSVTLTIVSRSGKTLFADTKVCSWGNSTNHLIKELRSRLED